MGRQVKHEPTPEEIEQRTAEIRAEWSDRTRHDRIVGKVAEVDIRTVRKMEQG